MSVRPTVRPRFSHLKVKPFIPMIAKLCWKHWFMLPPSIRVWLDIEDLLAECIAYIQMDSSKHYDGRAGVSTFIHMSTERYLLNVVKKFGCGKRNAPIVSVEPQDLPMIEPFSLSNLYETRLALKQMYEMASPSLKHQMQLWFSANPKFKKSSEFDRARKEFVRLSKDCNLSRHDYELLLKTQFGIL